MHGVMQSSFTLKRGSRKKVSTGEGECMVIIHLVLADRKPLEGICFTNDGSLVNGWIREDFSGYMEISNSSCLVDIDDTNFSISMRNIHLKPSLLSVWLSTKKDDMVLCRFSNV